MVCSPEELRIMSKDKGGRSHLEKIEDNVPGCDLEGSENDIYIIWQDNYGKEQELEVSSRDKDLLEPPERPQRSPSCSS